MILLVYNSFIFHSIYYNMHIVPYFALKNPTLFFFFSCFRVFAFFRIGCQIHVTLGRVCVYVFKTRFV